MSWLSNTFRWILSVWASFLAHPSEFAKPPANAESIYRPGYFDVEPASAVKYLGADFTATLRLPAGKRWQLHDPVRVPHCARDDSPINEFRVHAALAAPLRYGKHRFTPANFS
jgi:hypothetical protein